MAKKIKYSEPVSYFPKEIRDKILNKTEKSPDKKKRSTNKKK